MADGEKTMVSGVAAISAATAWTTAGRLDVFGAPEGADALAIADAARATKSLVLHIAREGTRAAAMVQSLKFFAPDIPVLEFPAWDCLPYDRVSPSPAAASKRMASLAAISSRGEGAFIVVAPINAAIQRTPPKTAWLIFFRPAPKSRCGSIFSATVWKACAPLTPKPSAPRVSSQAFRWRRRARFC
jgi:transcription-repair coupling factor (superfamily II helicase)